MMGISILMAVVMMASVASFTPNTSQQNFIVRTSMMVHSDGIIGKGNGNSFPPRHSALTQRLPEGCNGRIIRYGNGISRSRNQLSYSQWHMVSSSAAMEASFPSSSPDESPLTSTASSKSIGSIGSIGSSSSDDTVQKIEAVVETPSSAASISDPLALPVAAEGEPTTSTTASKPTATTTSPSSSSSAPSNGNKKTIQELRAEGGPLTFNTPIGALNPFAIYYGCVSIFLGIPWFFACKLCQFMYWVTRGKFDPKRRVPIFLSHVWGTLLMRLTRNYPTMTNLDILQDFYKEKRPAMFVANHCSWMDIPFLGATIGWRNYKLISKRELGAVPILGTAIRAGGHIMLDRTDRKSQIQTLKQGIQYLKDGIHLCTFPEGTRSRTGRLLKFKNGAFKMAYKAGAPIIPISIINSHKVMPTGWMMAMRPAHGLAEVIVHKPIESVGKTEEELAQAVRESMISGLPEEQVPPQE